MSELSIKIGGQRFDNWNNFKISLVYNSIASTFSFDGLILTQDRKKLFKPLSYHTCQVYFGNELLLTGTILNTSTSVSSNINLGSISGYSKPGILDDCSIPLESYPLQFDGLTLKEISEKLCKPFNIGISITDNVKDSMNEKYDTITADEEKTVKDFICELAIQKNIIVTHNAKGELVFTRLNIDKPSIATFLEGIPTTNISLSCNGQGLHSNITAQKQASIDIDSSGEETIKNDLVSIFRPIVKTQTTGTNKDTLSVAKRTRANELQAIQLTVDTDRWTWFDGKRTYIIKPNEIIHVQSEGNFINKRTKFFVESVELSGNEKGITATIKALLPEAYSGENPKNIFV